MITRLAVIVPAADEQERIGACLQAIERARHRVLISNLGIEAIDVVVVLDSCRDHTAAIVGTLAAAHVHVVETTARRVGAARRSGTLRALENAGPLEQLWLANTDADSTVPPQWLTQMVAAAHAGSHVVLGTVLPGADLPGAVRTSWLARHHLREGHPYVHGANFGIRADTYAALGGWRADLACNEDTDLADRAAATDGIRITRTAAIPVVTSARMAGRAPNGFSSYLRHLASNHTLTPARDRPAS